MLPRLLEFLAGKVAPFLYPGEHDSSPVGPTPKDSSILAGSHAIVGTRDHPFVLSSGYWYWYTDSGEEI